MALAIQLSDEEKNLRRSMDPQVEKVLCGKRLLLFDAMAKHAGVNDPLLFKDVVEGFRLTGSAPSSGIYPSKLRPASITVDQLKDSAAWAQKTVHASCRKVGADESVAAAVYEDTVQQVNDGWLVGPVTTQQSNDKYGGRWIPSKRFGVKQGLKIRAVDDFSEFLINSSVTTSERRTLCGIDEVVNAGRMFLGLDAIDGVLDTSEWWAVEQNTENKCLGRSLLGRGLDLKSAYKQLARHPQDAWASILAVWNPSLGRTEFYESVALPFGSVCAVVAFNRVARALRIIMSELFLLVKTNFFDDFCQLEDECLAESAWGTAEMVMKLLGWRISVSEDKRLPFLQVFNMLGSVLDLSVLLTLYRFNPAY